MYFSILLSLDGIENGVLLFTKRDSLVFGKNDDLPYTVDLPQGRVLLGLRQNYAWMGMLACTLANSKYCAASAHHRTKESRPQKPKIAQCVNSKKLRLDESRQNFGRIGGFWVFADTANYGNAILSAMTAGIYESVERKLVQKLLSHSR